MRNKTDLNVAFPLLRQVKTSLAIRLQGQKLTIMSLGYACRRPPLLDLPDFALRQLSLMQNKPHAEEAENGSLEELEQHVAASGVRLVHETLANGDFGMDAILHNLQRLAPRSCSSSGFALSWAEG